MAIGESKDRENEERIEELLTTKEVAALLKVSPRHVQNLVKDGTLPKPMLLGRSVRFRTPDSEIGRASCRERVCSVV